MVKVAKRFSEKILESENFILWKTDGEKSFIVTKLFPIKVENTLDKLRLENPQITILRINVIEDENIYLIRAWRDYGLEEIEIEIDPEKYSNLRKNFSENS